jgi:hypothetical protein
MLALDDRSAGRAGRDARQWTEPRRASRVPLRRAVARRAAPAYLQGIDSTEIIDTVHARRPPPADGPGRRNAPPLARPVLVQGGSRRRRAYARSMATDERSWLLRHLVEQARYVATLTEWARDKRFGR